jgi:hypothetical protein
MPLKSQYILSLLLSVVNNKNKFKLDSDVYNINFRQKHNFHQPPSNLSGVYSTGIKVFNGLPQKYKKFK